MASAMPATAPSMPRVHAPASTNPDCSSEQTTPTSVLVRNASQPVSELVCTPLTTPNAAVNALTRSNGANWGAERACAAIHGAKIANTTPYRQALSQVTPEDNARIRLAFSGLDVLNSAMCLTTVSPMPSPAMPPIMPDVALTMPYSPNPSRPSRRASRKETSRVTPRDSTNATPPQNAPWANRFRVPVPHSPARRAPKLEIRRNELDGSGICTGTMPNPPEKSSIRPALRRGEQAYPRWPTVTSR